VASSRPSARSSTLLDERREQELDEQAFEQIDVAMLYIEQARARTERAAAEMRKLGADAHLVEAMEQAQEDLSDLARRLRQGTFFAVPKEQLKL
jgi:GR25 family glycosyltransferase involved in LPS biosynthesis